MPYKPGRAQIGYFCKIPYSNLTVARKKNTQFGSMEANSMHQLPNTQRYFVNPELDRLDIKGRKFPPKYACMHVVLLWNQVMVKKRERGKIREKRK